MKRILYVLLFLVPLAACGQVREILITDTAYIEYRVSEDSTIDFSLKNKKKLKGHWTVYYDASKKNKAMEATFKKGKLTGIARQWYPDGKIFSERNCSNDTCTTDYYHPNGVVMKKDLETFNAVTGIRNWFYSATYCDNGQIKISPPLNPHSPNPQLLSTYYCSGTRKEEFTLQLVGTELLKIGYYTEWFEGGNVKVMGYYDDASPGKKTGVWNYYNEESKLIKQERYEDGNLAEEQIY